MAVTNKITNAGSSPNLSVTNSDDEPYVNYLRGCKRKHMDNDIEVLFEKFSSEISNKLTSWKSELDNAILNIQDNITSAIKSDLNNIKSNLKNIDEKQSQLFADMTSVKESLEFHSKEQKDLGDRVNVITTRTEKIDLDSIATKQEILNLKSELNIMQQRDRTHNLEITGLPEKLNENLYDYLIKIARHADVELTSDQIDHITRIQTRYKTFQSSKNNHR